MYFAYALMSACVANLEFLSDVVDLYNEKYDEVNQKSMELLKEQCFNSARQGMNEAEANVYHLLQDGFDHIKILERFAYEARQMGFEKVTKLDISHFWKQAGIKVAWNSHTKAQIMGRMQDAPLSLEPGSADCEKQEL